MLNTYSKIVILFTLFFGQFIYGQEPVSIHLTEENGLPDVEFYSMLEDQSGYMWLSGNKGLFRYDGEEFKSFSHSKKRGRSFFNLKTDAKGRVWCNNIAGQFFYVENNQLSLFIDLGNRLNGSLADYVIFKNYLVINGNKEILFINLDTKKIDAKPGIVGTSIGFVNEKNQLININEDYELSVYESPKKLKTLKNTDIKSFEAKETLGFTKYFKDHKDVYFFLFNKYKRDGKIYRFQSNVLTPLQIPKALKELHLDYVYIENAIWYVASSKGLFKLKRNGDSLEILSHYFQSTYITSIIRDFNKNLWVSTLNKGVYVIPNEDLIRYSNSNAISVIEKKSEFEAFIGDRKGHLKQLNLKKQQLKTVNHISDNSSIRALSYNKKTNKLLYVSDLKTVSINENNLENYTLKRLPSLKSLDKVNDTCYVVSLPHNAALISQNKTQELIGQRTYKSLVSRDKKQILVSSVKGLFLFDFPSLKSQTIRFKEKPVYAYDLTQTNDGVFWVATYNIGVLGIKNNKVVAHLNKEKGLASNVTNKIKADGNNLWISTESGLQLYDRTYHTYKTISKLNGINSYNINQLEVLGDEVVFSSNLGLFSFNKNSIFKPKNVPDVYFTQVIVNGIEQDLEPNYTLKQNASEITFNFHSKGFQASKFIEHYYQLKNFDTTWVKATNGQVKFNTLPEGDFTFNIKAKNRFGKTYSKTKSIQIKVVLPFYKQLWFYLLISMVTISVVVVYFKRKLRRKESLKQKELKQLELDKQLVNLKLENLRSQMNPHFIFNALNSIQEYIVLNQQNLASTYLVKFSRLIRMYLEQSQEQEVTLEQELQALKLYLELEKVRFEQELNYNLDVDTTLNQQLIKLPSLFIQPYIENALKHGLHHKLDNRNLNITFCQHKNQLICTITDNGIGREAANKLKQQHINFHKSFATQANKKRVDLINKDRKEKIKVEIIDLYTENNKPNGTQVLIKIPL